MSRRRKKNGPPPSDAARVHAPHLAPQLPPPDDEEEAPDLAALALDRLATSVHPELFLAFQDNLPPKDGRWLTLFAHAFDDQGVPSALLQLQPVSLNPVTFTLDGERLDARTTVERLVAVFAAFPGRVAEWQARLSHTVIVTLGEDRCGALRRTGMGEVIGDVETALMSRELLVPSSMSTGRFPLDPGKVRGLTEAQFAPALARSRLGEQLQLAFPDEDDEELDQLVGDAVRGLEFRAGGSPDFSVEGRAPGMPWVGSAAIFDALKRRLSGGLRVLRTM